MKRVLLVQPSIQPPGGGNGVAAWILQALTPVHKVTLLSWEPVDVAPINRFFGTALKPSDFDNLVVPAGWKYVHDHLPMPGSLIKLALLMRYTRKISAGFDVLFGVSNETDFGRRGIQYIHYPTYLRPRPSVDLRWYHSRIGLNLYYQLTDRIADFSLDRLKRNMTLVNSDWTGSHVSRFLGIHARTLYPPVVDPAPGLPWNDRRSAFLAIGRMSPEKEYERVMRILARVRERAPEVTLTIVGTSDRYARRYVESLTVLASQLGSWIQFRDNLTRDEVRQLMASHRYGIHGMREEHFGMAPAELARAGVVVWVPRGGGQMEIVGREPALMFDSDDDAVDKISRVLRDEEEQRRLQRLLERTAEQFSTARFVDQVRRLVDEFEG